MSELTHIEANSCPVCGNLCQVIEQQDGKQYRNLQVPSSAMQQAVEAIFEALDIPHYARPYSTETVIYKDIIPAIQRLREENAQLRAVSGE